MLIPNILQAESIEKIKPTLRLESIPFEVEEKRNVTKFFKSSAILFCVKR
jgi:hypothetical protein